MDALDGKGIEAALHCFRGAFEDVKAKENRATLVVLARIIEGGGRCVGEGQEGLSAKRQQLCSTRQHML